jgi:hypothetical protein
MSQFTLTNPGLLGAARDRWRFRHHFAAAGTTPPEQEEAAWVASIREHGFAQIPDFIAPGTLRQLQGELQQALERLEFETPCLAQAHIDPVRHADLLAANMYASTAELTRQGLTFDRPEVQSYQQAVQDFQPSTLTLYLLRHSAAYRQVWLDERLLRCVCAYLGMVPYLAEAYVRRNFPAPYRSMNHFWHRDLNSHYLLKAFFFLTDCSIESGPHEFICGTHRQLDVLNGKRYFEDEEVDRLFPPGSPRRLVSEVKAGTLIVEDTRGVHRARMPNAGFRDLGYAVFIPMPAGDTDPLYTVDRASMAGMSPLQRRFVPPAWVVDSP